MNKSFIIISAITAFFSTNVLAVELKPMDKTQTVKSKIKEQKSKDIKAKMGGMMGNQKSGPKGPVAKQFKPGSRSGNLPSVNTKRNG